MQPFEAMRLRMVITPSILVELANGPVYIAHLGAALRYPEETNIAYAGVAADGIIAVEQDLRLSADGSLVNSHDADATFVTTSSSNYSALSDAAISALTVDSSSWFGVDYPTAQVTFFSDVLTGYKGQVIFFPEIKDNAGSETVAELQAAGIQGVQAVVSSFDVAKLAPAVAAGYTTMLASTGADILTTAQSNGVDFVVYDKGAPAARFTDAVAAGVPVFAYTVDRRSERDYLLGLGAAGMYSNDPLYLSADAPSATSDAFAAQKWMAGMVPNKAANQSRPTAAERGRFFSPDYWGFSDSGVTTYQGVLQGWACPINSDPAADEYEIDLKATFGAPSDADQTRLASIVVAGSDEEFMDVGTGNTSPDAYHAVMRKNGVLQIYRVDAPNTGTLLVENSDGAAISDDAEHRFKLIVTPNKLRLARLDGSSNIIQDVTTGDMTAGHRGGYFHLGHSRLPMKFRDVSTAAVSQDLWTPFDLASRAELVMSDDSPLTIATGISQLNDISGNEYHVTQGTAGQQPASTANNLNNHRITQFDGGDDLNFPSGALGMLNNKPAAWGFVVYRQDVTDGAATDRILISLATNAAASRFAMFSGSSLGANKPVAGGRRLDADSFVSAVGPSALAEQWVIAYGELDYSARTVTLRANGAQIAQTTSAWSGSGNSSATNSLRARVGAGIGTSPAGNFNGKIAALIVGDALLSSTDVEKLEGWAAHRYGLTANLPGGHPYKTVPPTI